MDYGESRMDEAERELAVLKAEFEAEEARKRLLEMEERVSRMRGARSVESTVNNGAPPAKLPKATPGGGSTPGPTASTGAVTPDDGEHTIHYGRVLTPKAAQPETFTTTPPAVSIPNAPTPAMGSVVSVPTAPASSSNLAMPSDLA